MARKCRQCGYLNEESSERCELCGGSLVSEFSRDGHPHRVPSGLREVPGESSAPKRFAHTQLGYAGAGRDAVRAPSPPISDLGEMAGTAAIEDAVASRAATDEPGPPGRLLGHVKLVVEQGKIIGEQYLLSQPQMVIGRADPGHKSFPDIDLSAQDNDYVHRRHARILFYDLATRISVEHLGGHNPTLVNNEPVEPGELVELKLGDRLRTGRVVMRLAMA